jgi:hypothetical protein
MLKSGLIIGGSMLVVSVILAFLFPLCIPCLALFAGAGAGYLAGSFDRPGNNSLAVQRGAAAGAIGGLGALFGHLIGGLAAAVFIGPEAATDLARQFGIDPGASAATNPAAYYGGALLTGCCFGLFEVALMAGLGALGGVLWWQMTGSKGQDGMMTPPSMPA